MLEHTLNHKAKASSSSTALRFEPPSWWAIPAPRAPERNDKVAIEIVRYPTPYTEGQGVVSEILGQRGQPGVDTLSVIHSYNLPDQFDEPALEEARRQTLHYNPDELYGRIDLRDLPTLTIDPATARDFDDAISLARDEKGFWSLCVHIADVSWFVEADGELDRAARQRGTSVYLPDRVLPMLPELISNGLASLQEGQTRYTLSAFIELDPSGVVTHKHFARTAIRVDKRFTYEQAYKVMMRKGAIVNSADEASVRLLDMMLELAMLLKKRRFARARSSSTCPRSRSSSTTRGRLSAPNWWVTTRATR